MSWVADTSWLYSLVDSADPHHAAARRQAGEPSPVEVPAVILAETLDLIRYRQGRATAEAALSGFEGLPHFVLGESPAHGEVAAVWREHRNLSFADATAVAHARARRYGLRSFDRRQMRALSRASVE